MIYLREGHVVGFTLPLPELIEVRWRGGELTRVHADGSPWQGGDEYALPGSVPAGAAAPVVVAAAGPGRPAKNAPRIAWAAYAVELAACTEDEAGKLTRAELVELVTAPEDKPDGPAA